MLNVLRTAEGNTVLECRNWKLESSPSPSGSSLSVLMTNLRDNSPVTMIQCRGRDRPSDKCECGVFDLGFVSLR